MSKSSKNLSEFLRYGCLITLTLKENTFIHAPGFIDSSLYISSYPEISDFSQCIFRILPYCVHSVQSDLFRSLATNSRADYRNDYEKLADKLEGELKSNISSYLNQKGEIIRFGSVVYLQHVRSHRFLTVLHDEVCITDKDSVKVALEEFPNDNSYIKLQPSYNFQREGIGSIRKSDLVTLEVYIKDLRASAYIGIGDSNINIGSGDNIRLTKEVNAYYDKKPKWQLNMYYDENTDENKLIMCNDCIWIAQSEAKGALIGAFKDGHSLVFLNSTINHSNGLWQIENEDNRKGGLVHSQRPYRLKHLGSGKYLSIEANSENTFIGFLADKMHPNTLWVFEQIYGQQEKVKMTSDGFSSIRNLTTGVKMQAIDMIEQNNIIQLSFANDSSECSYFKLFKADFYTLWEAIFTLSCIPMLLPLKEFISVYSKSGVRIDLKTLEEFMQKFDIACECMNQIEQFLENKQKNIVSTNKNYGIIDKSRQKAIKELGIIDSLANLLENMFVSEFSMNKIVSSRRLNSERISDFSEIHNLEPITDLSLVIVKELTKLAEKIYYVIGLVCRENPDNQTYTFKLFEIFIKHAGYNLGATKCMSLILSDNEDLLLKIGKISSSNRSHRYISLVDHYVWLLKKFHKERKSHLVNFFRVLCISGDMGISSNQEKIHEAIFFIPESYNKVIIPTTIDYEKRRLNVIFKHPSGVGEESVDIVSCFSKGIICRFNTEIEYFINLTGALAMLCKGRNYICKASVNNLFPRAFLIEGIWNEDLTLDFRACLLELLMSMHVDFQPRSYTKKPELIRTLEATTPELERSYFNEKHTILSIDSGLDLIKNASAKLSARRNSKMSSLKLDAKPVEFTFVVKEDEIMMFSLKLDLITYFEEAVPEESSIFTLQLLKLATMLIKFEVVTSECSYKESKKCVFSPVSPEFRPENTDIYRLLRSIAKYIFSSPSHKSPRISHRRTFISDRYISKKSSDAKRSKNRSNFNESEEPFSKFCESVNKYLEFYILTSADISESLSIEISCKLELCNLLSLALDCRQDYLINNFIEWYKKVESFNISDLVQMIPPVSNMGYNKKKSNKKNFKNHLSLVFKPLTFINPKILGELFRMFLSTDYIKLKSEILGIILSMFSQRKNMVKSLKRVRIMVMESDPEIVIWAKLNISTFRNLAEQSEIICKYWIQNTTIYDKTLEKLETLNALLINFDDIMHSDCQLVDGVLQRTRSAIDYDRQIMLNNLEFHTHVISLIKDGLYILEEIYDGARNFEEKKAKQKLANLFSLCFKVLRTFTYRNKKNQKALFTHLHILSSSLRIQLGQIDLLCEIFRDNEDLSAETNEKFLQQFIDLIINEGRQAIFLNFFEVILDINGVGIPNIQRIVLMLLTQPNSYLHVCYMGSQEQFEFSASQNCMSELYVDQPFGYHNKLINVLTKCGRSSTGFQLTKAKCQKIIPLSMIFDLLMKEGEYKMLEYPVLDFFHEVYLSSELVSEELENCNEFFRLIDFKTEKLSGASLEHDSSVIGLEKWLQVLITYYEKYIKTKHNILNYAKGFIEKYVRMLNAKWDLMQGVRVTPELQRAVDLLGSYFSIEFNEFAKENDVVLKQEVMYSSDKLRWTEIVKSLSQKNIKELIKEEYLEFLQFINNINSLCEGVDRKSAIESLVEFISLASVFKSSTKVQYTIIKFMSYYLSYPERLGSESLKEAKTRQHEELRECKIVPIILQIMCDKTLDKRIFSALINFSNKILEGGNDKIQQEFFDYFTNTRKSERFFYKLHSVISDYISLLSLTLESDLKNQSIFHDSNKLITNIIKLLQLFCENHYDMLQNYIRNQENSQNNYDLVMTIIILLQGLMRSKRCDTFLLISQCFETLTESIQGPCKQNQKAIVDSKFLEIAADLLSIDERSENNQVYSPLIIDKNYERAGISDDNLKGWMISHLKYKCLITLLALIEGQNDHYVLIRMARTFNLQIFRENLVSIYKSYIELYKHGFYSKELFNHFDKTQSYNVKDLNSYQKSNEKTLIIEIGFYIYFLLKYFEELKDKEVQKLLINDFPEFLEYSSKDSIRSKQINPTLLRSRTNMQDSEMLLKAIAFFDSNTGSIEVVFQGVLCVTHFWLPPFCHHLTSEVKNEYKKNVDRSSDKKKLQYLISSIDEMIEEMEYEQTLSTAYGYKFMGRHISKLKLIVFWISIWLNIVILLSYSAYDADRFTEPSYMNVDIYNIDSSRITSTKQHIFSVGVIHCALSGIIFLYFIIKTAPILIRRQWRQQASQNNDSTKTLAARLSLRLKKYLLTIFYTISNLEVLYHLFYFSFSILALAIHPFFFAAHLIEIIYRFNSLRNIVLTLVVTWKGLALTGIFIIVIVYWFAVWAYFRLHEDFAGECNSIMRCIIAVFDKGYKFSGGIGMYLDSVTEPPEDGHFRPERFVYDNLFTIINLWIMLNLVQGFIYITFTVVRQKHESMLDDIKNKCFICGLDRERIERLTGAPLEYHRTHEHNKWNYLYFLAYLTFKVDTDLSGVESYVKQMNEAKKLDWIPQKQGTSFQIKEKIEEVAIFEAIEEINTQIIRVQKGMKLISRDLKSEESRNLSPNNVFL